MLRKPKDFKAQHPGHCVALDTIERFIHGCRRYVITFEDLYSRFAFAWSTTSHASKAAEEFFRFCQMVFPVPFEYVLTDNGSEFKKHFAERLSELHLTHYHTYPKTPKMNAHCERFNRTIQEEFVDYHAHALLEPAKFNVILMEYGLVWFNTERPHYALELQSPSSFCYSGHRPRKSAITGGLIQEVFVRRTICYCSAMTMISTKRPSLDQHLRTVSAAPDDLRHLIMDIAKTAKDIHHAIRTSEAGLSRQHQPIR